jgi:hypothetical protein
MLGGLSGPFSKRAPAHCPRCRADVEATWPWSGWGTLKRAHLAGICLLLLLSPFFYADFIVMLPSSMLFAFAIGPVMSLARIKPTCLQCGAAVGPLRPLHVVREPG